MKHTSAIQLWNHATCHMGEYAACIMPLGAAALARDLKTALNLVSSKRAWDKKHAEAAHCVALFLREWADAIDSTIHDDESKDQPRPAGAKEEA